MPERARQALESGDQASQEACLGLGAELGELREDTDHTGAICMTIDCILSPIVLKEAESDRCFALLRFEVDKLSS